MLPSSGVKFFVMARHSRRQHKSVGHLRPEPGLDSLHNSNTTIKRYEIFLCDKASNPSNSLPSGGVEFLVIARMVPVAQSFTLKPVGDFRPEQGGWDRDDGAYTKTYVSKFRSHPTPCPGERIRWPD